MMTVKTDYSALPEDAPSKQINTFDLKISSNIDVNKSGVKYMNFIKTNHAVHYTILIQHTLLYISISR